MFFNEIEEGKPDAIFGLSEAFKKDPRREKVNLLVGVYKNESLECERLSSVQKAVETIGSMQVDYLPIDGYRPFCEGIQNLVLKEPAYVVQTIGGTGALRLGADVLRRFVSNRVVLSSPTWPNHRNIFERAGFEVGEYPYYSFEKKGVDFEAMLLFLERLEPKTVVLLQPVCHNPTGCELSLEQWEKVINLIQKKELFPFLDCAYQGFSFSLEEDVAPIQLFQKKGVEFFLAYSCSKNFGMYCQRVGALVVSSENRENLKTQIKPEVRALYSNPPLYGAKIVATILEDRSLYEAWEKDVQQMRERLSLMREALAELLPSFSYLKSHRGMFSYLGLTPQQVARLQKEHGIYMTGNGRISVAGLNKENLDMVAKSILQVL